MSPPGGGRLAALNLTAMHSTIERFQIVDDALATAAQPAAEHFSWLKQQGFDAVVNISTPTARNFLRDEATIAMAAGLDYVHAPVDCTSLDVQHYETLRGVLSAFKGKKVLVHCAGNVKASGLMHLYRVKELGQQAAPLREQLRMQGWHEPKWFAYFDRMGV